MKPKPKATASKWYRLNLWIHRWVSLVIVIPFFILSVTGLILIFHEEIDRAMGYIPPSNQQVTADYHSMENILNIARQQYPDRQVAATSINMDQFPPNVMTIAMALPGEDTRKATWLYADRSTASLTERPEERKTITGFLLELHGQWFLGFIGELIGALIALLVLFSLVSGMVVYAPYVKKFLFGIVRRDKGPRILQLDLHNLIGSVVLGWALVVTVTGIFLGVATLMIALTQMTELKKLQQQYPQSAAINTEITIDQVYEAATQGSEGWTPRTVFYPQTPFSTQGHYLVLLQGAGGIQQELRKVALVDAATGKLTTTGELPFYLKIIFLSEPLHFGNYGGIPLKILWSLCTLLTLFITMNGAWLWWTKRKPKSAKTLLEKQIIRKKGI